LDLSAALGAAKGKQTREKFREVKGKKMEALKIK
jgi:hypothetical protein